MASTEILPFALDPSANVQSQADYAAVSSRTLGFSDGIAPTQEVNKVWRQACFMAAGLANWIVSKGTSVPDDGNLTNLVAEIQAAIKAAIDAEVTGALPSGTLFNFQSTTVTAPSTQSGAAAWTDISGLSVSITPVSTSDKVLVRAVVSLCPGDVTNNATHLRLMRGSTPIGIGGSSGSRSQATGSTEDGNLNGQTTVVLEFLDSPGSTSAQTYKVQCNNASSQLVTFQATGNDTNDAQHARTVSTISAVEVKV